MPVEIRELVIRAVAGTMGEEEAVEVPVDDARAAAPGAAAGKGAVVEVAAQGAVVQAAVKEVLRILRASKER